MGQSVEALLDPALDASVRDEWRTLERAGIAGVAAHASSSHRPHVTLAYAGSYPESSEQRLAGVILEGRGLPIEVRLGGLVVFGQRSGKHQAFVLARAVVVSRDLLDLHERVARLLADSPGFSATARPGEWTPHVTLGRLRAPEAVGAAVGALAGRHRSQTGRIVAVRRWDGERRVERVVAGSLAEDGEPGAIPTARPAASSDDGGVPLSG